MSPGGDPAQPRSLLEAYVDGWRRRDVDTVLATLTEDCVVVESYGPVYRGRARVAQWMRAWFGAGGTVDAWELTSPIVAGDLLVAEWAFTCTWDGRHSSFDGVTLARVQSGRIAWLREYATTAPLYDWSGVWKA